MAALFLDEFQPTAHVGQFAEQCCDQSGGVNERAFFEMLDQLRPRFMSRHTCRRCHCEPTDAAVMTVRFRLFFTGWDRQFDADGGLGLPARDG